MNIIALILHDRIANAIVQMLFIRSIMTIIMRMIMNNFTAFYIYYLWWAAPPRPPAFHCYTMLSTTALFF